MTYAGDELKGYGNLVLIKHSDGYTTAYAHADRLLVQRGDFVAKGQVIAVVQPHRYTRLKTLFEPFSTCFNDADAVIVANVYPAGEAPIEGADRDHLVEAVRARGHRNVVPLDGPEKLAGIIKSLAKPGDYVVCLGAGSITQWAYALPGELKAL